MRKIYIYGDNPEVITVMREGLKDFLCNSGYYRENAESAFGYAGVIQNAGELIVRVQKSVLP
ncbi:hypothetical protein RZT35_005514, partial [Salmonella enterica]|nr:hypothetical protein [Salmonella enterica]